MAAKRRADKPIESFAAKPSRVAQKWKAAPLELKRAVIRAMTVVTILPIGSGAKPTPESIHIQGRTAGGRLIDAV